jgi:hypothetical protein
MRKKEKSKIPPHTKWGIRITTVIIILLTAMIIRNCLGSFRYGVGTEEERQKEYYEMGYQHGRQKAQGAGNEAEPETDNLLLKKLYRKGFRDGWDSINHSRKMPAPPGENPTEKK